MRNKKLNIYKRKDGRYEGRLYLADCGTKRYKSVYGKTEKEAAEKMLEYSKQLKYGERTVKSNRYFNDLLDEWLSTLNVKDSTICCYKTKIDNHIRIYFKGVKYGIVDEIRIQEFITILSDKGLSRKYIGDIISIVKTFAKWVKKTYHFENRIADISVPKSKHVSVDILSHAEQEKLCKHIKSHPDNYNIGIYIALNTGIRIGELCALTWGDIDLEKKTLRVTKTAQRIAVDEEERKTAVRLTSPKTESSVREIPLPEYLADFLKPFAGDRDSYVLSGTSRIVEPRVMTFSFKRTLKEANVPSVKFHSLRHCFATNCLQAGFDIKTLSEILGHANAATTMKIYIHSSMERKRECMSLLNPAA